MKKISLQQVIILVVLIGIGLISAAQATLVRVANLQDLVEQSNRIFVGKCVSEETGSAQGIPYTLYRFEVVDGIKGVSKVINTITIKQFGLAKPMPLNDGSGLVKTTSIPGMPRYEAGQKVLLFMVKESRIGLSSPVGLQQGAFSILGEGDNRKVTNTLNNRNLAQNLSPAWLQSRGLSAAQATQLSTFEGGPMNYNVFIQMLKKMVATQAP